MPKQENNNLKSITKIAQSTIPLFPLAKEVHKHFDNIFIKRLAKRPFTLRQTDLQDFYSQMNFTHYITIYLSIHRGMCYGYTIYWLATMRAAHERKLLGSNAVSFTAEELCFYRIINTLNKYHRDPESIPEDTKESLKQAFNKIVNIQKKQIPDEYFEPSNNFFFALLPDQGASDEDNFYEELITVLSTLDAGTCIWIAVPGHAIGCYIDEDQICFLDPNDTDIIFVDKLPSANDLAKLSLFYEKNPKAPSNIANIFNPYYKKHAKNQSKIIFFNTLTKLNPDQIEKVRHFNKRHLDSIQENKAFPKLTEHGGSYFLSKMITNELVADDDKGPSISRLSSDDSFLNCGNKLQKEIMASLQKYGNTYGNKQIQSTIDNLQSTIEANKDHQSPKPRP